MPLEQAQHAIVLVLASWQAGITAIEVSDRRSDRRTPPCVRPARIRTCFVVDTMILGPCECGMYISD